MTELAKITNATPAVEGPTLMQKGVEKLRQHAQLKMMAMEYADFITSTTACPEIYRGKPNDAAAAIIRGTALGFDPDGALEAFFVIKGKVGMYARAMAAVAENAGCTMWEVEASDESVTWQGQKPGSDHVQEVTWTIDRAKKAGYTSNQRYKTNPAEMLRSKCQAELSRILAPGALMGLYSETEESAFDQKPIKATAQRVQPQRGMDKVRAALEKKKPETIDAESSTVSTQGEKLAEWVAAASADKLAGFLDSMPSKLEEGTDPAPLLDAVMDRAEELGIDQEQLDFLAEQAAKTAAELGVS